jgi:hypothetical protein
MAMTPHHKMMQTNRRHEREKRTMRHEHHQQHGAMAERHNNEEAELNARHEMEMMGAAPGADAQQAPVQGATPTPGGPAAPEAPQGAGV